MLQLQLTFDQTVVGQLNLNLLWFILNLHLLGWKQLIKKVQYSRIAILLLLLDFGITLREWLYNNGEIQISLFSMTSPGRCSKNLHRAALLPKRGPKHCVALILQCRIKIKLVSLQTRGRCQECLLRATVETTLTLTLQSTLYCDTWIVD